VTGWPAARRESSYIDALAQAATARAPRHVAPFKLRADRIYVVMPRYIDTFERKPPLNDAENIVLLWENVPAALTTSMGSASRMATLSPQTRVSMEAVPFSLAISTVSRILA